MTLLHAIFAASMRLPSSNQQCGQQPMCSGQISIKDIWSLAAMPDQMMTRREQRYQTMAPSSKTPLTELGFYREEFLNHDDVHIHVQPYTLLCAIVYEAYMIWKAIKMSSITTISSPCIASLCVYENVLYVFIRMASLRHTFLPSLAMQRLLARPAAGDVRKSKRRQNTSDGI